MTKTLVTFSIYANGALVDRRYVTDEDDPDLINQIAEKHARWCVSIATWGGDYLVDIEFWDGEHVRWGTDDNGMVQPFETGIEQLEAAINRMRRERGTA